MYSCIYVDIFFSFTPVSSFQPSELVQASLQCYEDMQSHDYDITYWNIYSLYLDKYINIHIYHEYMIGAPATLHCTGRKEVNWHLMNKRKVEMHDCS